MTLPGQPGRPRWLRPVGAPLRRGVGLRALQPGDGRGGRGPGDAELSRRVQRGHPGCLGRRGKPVLGASTWENEWEL